MADAAGGQFIAANAGAELERALRRSVAAPYRVEDAAGGSVAQGAVGGSPQALPAGRYRIRIEGSAETDAGWSVDLVEGKTTHLEVTKAGQTVDVAVRQRSVAYIVRSIALPAASRPFVIARAAARPQLQSPGSRSKARGVGQQRPGMLRPDIESELA